jgi:hypothetical protein
MTMGHKMVGSSVKMPQRTKKVLEKAALRESSRRRFPVSCSFLIREAVDLFLIQRNADLVAEVIAEETQAATA